MGADSEKKPFLFSVIMSVYNVEPYINEAIDSVIRQDFGFESIQLILVNDGSADRSGEICDEYQAKYPNNIEVVHKANGGLSSARNAGMKRVRGEWVSFFDPDDILSPNTFSEVAKFIGDHGDETDVIAIPIFMFGDQEGPHPLNDKFSRGSRVIDLKRDWQYTQMSLASAFVKVSVAKAVAFQDNLNLVVAEDARELTKILPLRCTLGVVADVQYLYRKRGDSNVGSARAKKGWYAPYLREFSVWVLDYCTAHFGAVPLFIQFMVMYDLQWKLRMKEIPEGVLTEGEKDAYFALLWDTVKRIAPEVIAAQRQLNDNQKYYILHQHFNIETLSAATLPVNVHFMSIDKDQLTIEGTLATETDAAFCGGEVFLKVNGRRIALEDNHYFREESMLEREIAQAHGFRVSVPLTENSTVTFWRSTDHGDVRVNRLVLGKYSPVGRLAHSYYAKDGWLLVCKDGRIEVKQKKHYFWSNEIPLLCELLKSKKLGARKAVPVRLLYRVLKLFMRSKKIWLICDKANRADDNGEAFFKFVCRQKGVKPIFLVSKESADFARLKQYGTVLSYMSWGHKIAYLFADFVLSAYSHDEINNPFLGHHEPFRDLLQRPRFVFLQHGITKDDISAGTNKYHKNFTGFVTAAKAEYDSIAENQANYGYQPEQIWLTGFPRYDYLYHDEQKSIVIMPTWRRSLFGAYHAENSQWDLCPGFENSDYYQFYNGLIHSERLLTAASELGYKIVFVPHPVLFPYLDRFSPDPRIDMKGTDVVYREMFAQNMLLLTDFSSVAFDFAYLRKPVVYAHFDSNHYAEGYFDYERDGFGEVESTLEGTIDRLIEYMQNGCQLKPEYRKRIDAFFAFNDKNNCQRVYDKLMEFYAPKKEG